jgi:hypothetical protein
LFRAAQLLVPASADARAIAALAQLRERYVPTVCPRAVAGELRTSALSDPDDSDAGTALRQFDELALNAPPAGTPAVHDAAHPAEQRLAGPWRSRPPSSPRGTQLTFGAGLACAGCSSASDGSAGVAPAGRFEITWRARDGSGFFPLRFAATMPALRSIAIGSGLALWTRAMVGWQPGHRWRFGTRYAEIQGGPSVGASYAQGRGYSVNHVDAGFEAALDGGVRLAWLRLTPVLTLWTSLSASYFVGRRLSADTATVQVTNVAGPATHLPDWEATLAFGGSWFLW